MGTVVASEREEIYEEDIQGGASVSEAMLGKMAGTMNFILNRIVQKIQFGVTGNYFSGLATPYTFSQNSESMSENCQIQRISVAQEIAGTAGTTTFKIERRPVASGIWTTIFSVNCSIAHNASDAIVFNSDEAAPANVTLPVLSQTTLDKGDELRFVLVSAATGARNLLCNVEVSPI